MKVEREGYKLVHFERLGNGTHKLQDNALHLNGEVIIEEQFGRICIHLKEDSAPAWDGEGLPPAGVPVEYRRRLAPNNKWYLTQINFLSGQHVIYCDSDGDEVRDNPDDIEFRPIRTLEQIAAEERKRSILQMQNDASHHANKDLFEKLYDAGYRKQVQP